MVFKRVDGYEVDADRQLGRGMFGEVFIGRHSVTKILVAAKKIWVDEEDTEQVKDVMKEVEALKDVPPHRNIAKYLGKERTDTHLWIFTEYCAEGDLNKFASRNDLDLEKKLQIMEDCVTALVHLHELHPAIVHRDVKPENVLIAKEEDAQVAKLCDFGTAKVTSKERGGATVHMHTMCGTGEFMAPELFEYERAGKVSYNKSIDIFSLGLLYLALVEAPPRTKLQAMYGECQSCTMSPSSGNVW
jgi:serine/threonine protein kinase